MNEPGSGRHEPTVGGGPDDGGDAAAAVRPDADHEELAALEPSDLDGHSIDELSDYLDAGMLPPEPSIDDSAACQNALSAIIRIRRATLGSLEVAAADEPPADEGWVGRVLENISFESRAGRDIPLRSSRESERAVLTEGAVRAMVRRAADGVPGVLVAKVALDGEVSELGAPVRVSVSIGVPWGPPMTETADLVRAAITEVLRDQTELLVEAVDVQVRDVMRDDGNAEERS